MGTIDLRLLGGDEIVIHFGGSLKSVNAYTFANSLVSFADAVRDVNNVIDPERSIEIRVEALGPGSFRARIKKLQKGLRGFFSDGAKSVFWSIVGVLIYDNLFDEEPKITINDDSVIYEYGNDRIILPRDAHTHFENVKNSESASKNIRKTFGAIEQDEAVENFGLTHEIDDVDPIVQFSREEIASIAGTAIAVADFGSRRERTERAMLVILKAWLKAGNNKWSFDWNGVPIAAPIKDHSFLNRLVDHEISIGVGDAIEAVVSFEQDYDEALGIWVTDQHSYKVVEVLNFVEREKAPE